MALRFATDEVITRHGLADREDAPVRLVFKRDAQGVATLIDCIKGRRWPLMSC